MSEFFGKNSLEADSLKQFKGELYDQTFGYRVIEALRNHVQHCGLPVHTITYNFSREPAKDAEYIRQTVAPMLSHTELALNGDFKSSVLQELQKNSKDLDLRVPVREYISCLILIHGKVRELISGVVNDARTKYNAAIEQFTIMNGELVEFAWFQICNEMGERLEKFDLVSEFLTLYDKLYKRNSGVHDLRRKYASGATHKPLWV